MGLCLRKQTLQNDLASSALHILAHLQCLVSQLLGGGARQHVNISQELWICPTDLLLPFLHARWQRRCHAQQSSNRKRCRRCPKKQAGHLLPQMEGSEHLLEKKSRLGI